MTRERSASFRMVAAAALATLIGAGSAARSAAPSTVFRLVCIKPNSSPPKRATVSVSRTQARIRWAISLSN